MKTIFIILLVFSWVKVKAQYVEYWESKGHTIYNVQQSYDTLHWKTIGVVNAKLSDTSFSYALTTPGTFNRVIADKDSSWSILLPVVLPIRLHRVKIIKITYP